MTVAGVVITHGPDRHLEAGMRALRPQVDEMVVVANLGTSGEELPPDTALIENERPMGFAANANQGIAATTAPFVLLANPDTVATPTAVETLVAFAEAHPRAGVIGPQLVYPEGGWQPSRRAFPTVWGTLVRRTPLRWVLDPARFSRTHYALDRQPDRPEKVDWMLGAFLLLRREMLDDIGWFDEGFRLYGEDIDLCYRAEHAGWDRWYVPEAVVTHAHNAVTDKQLFTRRTAWHWKGIARFVRKHPERVRALR